MRCEICGVPVAEEETRCGRCTSQTEAPAHPSEGKDTLRDTGEFLKKASSQFNRPYLNPSSDGIKGSSVILENKYQLLDEIGRGAMGTVFLAEDMSLKRKVAIKFLLPELDSSVECAIRFRQEAVGMASVRDNNVAQIYSYAEHGDKLYFVMEYLKGESVESLIDSHNRRGMFVSLSDVIDILVQSACGLSAIHRAGVIHRDIKPANMMYTDDGARVVIMDFGLVRNVEIEHELRSLVGSPAYMAPELAEGVPDADRTPAIDIYSLGVTAYELLTGVLPFDGDSWVEIIRKHISEVPPFPSERRSGLPELVDGLIFRMLSKDPKERPESCEELLDELYQLERMSLPPSTDQMEVRRGSGSASMRPKRRSSRKPRAPHSAGPSRPPSGITRGRLLVVDPDPGFRAQVHKVAKSTVPGCRVFSATDGVMALKMFEEVHPSAVLLDLRLPEINGLEVTATLRGDSANDPVSIIVVADKGGLREAEILKNLKVNRYLTKPIDADTLANELRPLLERPIGARYKPPAV